MQELQSYRIWFKNSLAYFLTIWSWVNLFLQMDNKEKCRIIWYLFQEMGFSGGASGEEPTCQCRRLKRHEFHYWISVGKIPWRRAWQPTPELLPGESHGQRNLAGSIGCQSRTVHRITKSWTWLKQLSMHTCQETHPNSLNLLINNVNKENSSCNLHGN